MKNLLLEGKLCIWEGDNAVLVKAYEKESFCQFIKFIYIFFYFILFYFFLQLNETAVLCSHSLD